MLLNDVISIIKTIEDKCDKEINVIRFSELNPSEIYEIVFTPDYLYMDYGIDTDESDMHNRPGGTD